MKFDLKDAMAGTFFSLIGGYVLFECLSRLEFGTPDRIGPAFFPSIVAGLLMLWGLMILVSAFAPNAGEAEAETDVIAGAFPWRAAIFICASFIACGLLMRTAGAVPAFAVTLFIASFASRSMSWTTRLACVVGFTAFCAFVFLYAMELRIPAIGPMLRIWN